MSMAQKGGFKVYEELGTAPANIQKDHVIISDAASLPESETVECANQWQSLVADVPEMSAEMVVTADLMFKTDAFLTRNLNRRLRAANLRQVNHVSDVVYSLEDMTLPKRVHDRLEAEVQQFLTDLGSTSPAAAIQQWSTLVEWMQIRSSCVHPLGDGAIDAAKLPVVGNAISTAPEFADVREAATVLVKAAQFLLENGPAAVI